jgi:hypothetical protein
LNECVEQLKKKKLEVNVMKKNVVVKNEFKLNEKKKNVVDV